MKKKIITGIVSIFALILFLAPGKEDVNYDDFARCLTEQGAVMYGTYWCSHCKTQKRDFGDSFRLIDYVECSEYPDVCTEKGIDGFPTWVIDDAQYPGRQSFSRLSSLTKCKLPKEVNK
ncbi:hypothetical protein GF336_00105 [Candidatus Woesearchaeota archaeon]|nr:hypothetical protein [Candidatus Woesearchaeota archaeon]